ncbi:MAG: AAA family ATPase [Desulfovibrionaceae bacterium]|nr:AAA family ATPase [Desulfovibrionaceae bacterium]
MENTPAFQFAASLRQRDILARMVEYRENASLKTGILYGLRRTGKSVLLRQWLLGLPYEERAKAAYLTIESEGFADIKNDLNTLRNNGYKYIVLDEITACEDFIESCKSLANNYTASGMKIFIAGTDSLSLWLALSGGLFDRDCTLHTTHVPFAEWTKLKGAMSLDEYIRFGGLLHLDPTEGECRHSAPLPWTTDAMRRYFTSSISDNILNTLRNFKDGENAGLLGSLLDEIDMDAAVYGLFGSLTRREFLNYIEEIVAVEEKYLISALKSLLLADSHTYDEKLMFRNFKLPDVSRTASVFKGKDDELYKVLKHLSKSLRGNAETMLCVKNAIGRYVTAAQFLDIVEYLRKLEVLAMRPAIAFPPVGASVADYVRYNAINRELHTQNLVSQPGLRYAQADIMRKLIEDDAGFRSIKDERKKKLIVQKFQEGVYGMMQEDIAIYETMQQCKLFGGMSLGDNTWETYNSLPIKAYKAEFPDVVYEGRDKEIDLVIEDVRDGSTLYLIEIKHSTEREENQSKWLKDKDVSARICRTDGDIRCRAVLYNGEPYTDGAIRYVNIEDYLNTLQYEGLENVLRMLCDGKRS